METSPPPERRTLRFGSVAEAIAEARRCVESERAGKLRRAGTWTLGQNLGHLAAWIDYAFGGYPFEAPAELRERARSRKNFVLGKGMTPGFRIPGLAAGTAGTRDMPSAEGLAWFESAWTRLQQECPTGEHAFFGPLTHGEWVELNLRHAELHLGFIGE